MYSLTEFYNQVVPEEEKRKYSNLSRFSPHPPELLWEGVVNPGKSYLNFLKNEAQPTSTTLNFPTEVSAYLPEGVNLEVAEQWRIGNVINLTTSSTYDARLSYNERKLNRSFYDIIVLDPDETPSLFFKDLFPLYTDAVKYINLQDELLSDPARALITPEFLEISKVNFGINPTTGVTWLDYVSPVNETILAGTIMLRYIDLALG